MSDAPKSPTQLPLNEKRALLARLLRERENAQRSFPLSPVQERLWFLNKLHPGNPLSTLAIALRLTGQLQISALERCFQTLLRRHNALRLTFQSANEQVMQTPASLLLLPLPVIDLQQVPGDERNRQVQTLMKEEFHHPFDLARSPLLRIHLLRLGLKEHVLLFTLHRLIADEGSMEILISELAILYQSYCTNHPGELPPVRLHYTDVLSQQRVWLQSDAQQQELLYWTQQLAGAPFLLKLPLDRPRPPVQTFQSASLPFALPQHITDQVKEYSRFEGTSPVIVFLAVFQVLLYRYSGQENLIIGIPVANRKHPDLRGIVGNIANILPLRADLSGNPSFRELLGQVHAAADSAFAHQHLPFERLVESLQPERDLSHSPLFQVVFDMRKPPVLPLASGGLSIRPLTFTEQMGAFDLTLRVEEAGQTLHAIFQYNPDIFEATRIERMWRHFRLLLHAVLTNSEQKIAYLPFLTESERHQLLVTWNETKANIPRDSRLHELVEAQVRRTPDAVASVCQNEVLTYAELNRQANQIAHHLRKLGVAPGVRVGLCIERTSKMPVALLAVLKAGGTYVPLDPVYPSERLAFLIRDSQIAVLITQADLLPCLPGCLPPVLCLDADQATLEQESARNPRLPGSADDIAYIIYTSGSTGKPKGVELSHRSVAHLLHTMGQRLALTAQDTFLAITTFAFDISVFELFFPLTTGAHCVLVDRHVAADAARLIRYLATHDITVLQATPATWQLLIDANWHGKPGLKMISTGEALPPTLAVHLLKKGACLWNLYGPTETTIWSTAHPVSDSDSAILIGRPIANTRLYVLDRWLQPVPIGVPGELFVGGIGLARGYLHRPELTAEKFIPDPFASEPGSRLYRTGDLVQFLPDGNLEYLGRIDHQVKIRGIRIEPGEIEGTLVQHPQVRDAVVVARDASPGDKRLVAYIVPTQVPAPSAIALRMFLKHSLPEYMLPSTFVPLEALPLTSNGKIDRRALLVHQMPPEKESAFGVPKTPIEEMLSKAWQRVLGRKTVGVHDNFFELGGNSIQAVQLVSRIQAGFQFELPLRAIFEYPTVVEQARLIEELRGEGSASLVPPLIPAHRGEELPLSFAQERMWFMDQLIPQSPLYNISTVIRIRGPLNITVMEQSFSEIIRRQESLRTSFISVRGTPQQVIGPARLLRLSVVDLANLTAGERERLMQQFAQFEAKQPFDLANGPLFRLLLLRLSQQEHALFLTMHHIISDGWSMNILMQELITLYRAFKAGQPSPLPDLPIQYADFARWQRQWLQGKVQARQVDYWKKQLDNAPPLLPLPTDRPRPRGQTFGGSTCSFTIPGPLSASIKSLHESSGTTLFMKLLAAFQILLARYTGQEDIVIGSPIANRTRVEVENIIGFFVNTLVLRTSLAGNPTFSELLQRVREVTLGAYANQDLPFEKLVQIIQPERDLSRNPLFQVMFVLQNTPGFDQAISELTFLASDEGSDMAGFDLTLFMAESQQGLDGLVEYNTDLFDRTTITRLIEHFQTLLAEIVLHPEYPISEFTLLKPAEQHQILVAWNATHVPFPPVDCITTLFEEQVERIPDALAVVFEQEQLSYGALNEQANQLAHYLKGQRVGPEVRVGICMERSTDLIIGLLAVLKAGGMYVPLDPSYPRARLKYMISEAEVSLILTQPELKILLPENDIPHLYLRTMRDTLTCESVANPEKTIDPQNLAYIIYTSGSTGKPKGVMVTRASLVNAFWAWGHAYHLRTRCANCLQMANFSFDVFTADVVRALCAGLKMVFCPHESLLAPEKLYALLHEQAIDTAEFVPAVARSLVHYLKETGQSLFFMRLLIVGSDFWYIKELKELQEFCRPETLLVNSYGVTEATIDSSYFVNSSPNLISDAVALIGSPFANIQMYILDSHLRPVPVGVYGELYIGGPGLARGYLHQPALTAERFLPHPFSTKPGERLYKTGDRARYTPDGTIEFFGRHDSQIKIRGYRIEPGEIEAVLNSSPAVYEAVVQPRDYKGTRQLVAYVVPVRNQAFSSQEVRSFLRQHLPDYMLPSLFVPLQTLPLTANGKVDRRALPAPDTSNHERGDMFALPRTPVEEMLVDIWREVLGTERVNIYESFFDLGGHSLLATQVISRIRTVFDVDLPLRTLFEAPTIASLAGYLVAARQHAPQTPVPPISPAPSKTPVPLSFSQERLWFLDQLEPGNPSYTIPLALSFHGPLQVRILEHSLNRLVDRHEILRTTFRTRDGHPLQFIASEMPLDLQVVDLCRVSAEEQEQQLHSLLLMAIQLPFDLTNGPLVRGTLFCKGPEDYLLLLTLHHILCDGWSMGIVMREMAALYTAMATNSPAPLAELPIQYADFAVWQRERLRGKVREDQLAYWRQQLADAPQLELPLDHPRPPIPTFHGATAAFEITLSLTARLKQISRDEGCTLFMTLLAAFQILLARYSRQEDVVVGTPIANRTRSELEGMIGCFVNTLVLRTNLSGDPSFRQLLRRVREVTFEAYTYQELPFEQLVESLQPARDLSRNPFFQVMFILQQATVSSFDFPGIAVTPQDIDSGTSKFDLTLSVGEAPDGLKGAIEYNTDLFDERTIRRLIGHFKVLLEGIAAHPDAAIKDFSLLTPYEYQQIIHEWNQNQTIASQECCLHTLIERQAAITPDAIAVNYGTSFLTYAHLNLRANQLAHRLRNLGVGPETRVGLYVERSLEMLIGMLAILKAGGAYVPLDPAYPARRLSFILQDAQLPILITQTPLLAHITTQHVQILCLDTDPLPQEHHESPEVLTTPDNIAYVIYTSGSTGTPKGVQVSHRSVTHLLQYMSRQLTLTARDRLLALTTFTFDISVFELFQPLTTGASVVLIDRETAMDGKLLAQSLVHLGITIMQATPSTWQLLLESGWSGSMPLVMMSTGEALPVFLATQLLERGTCLWNLYGPTETTIWSSVHPVREGERSISIGRPIANTSFYVLDNHLLPVPTGVPGELYIGGIGLARGYLHRPELTAEYFLPDPFSQEASARMYRTGDLVKYLADGTLEYVGRLDNQVKLHGFRIELGEVENTLRLHPSVQDAVVVLQEQASDKRLVACLIPTGRRSISSQELRLFLQKHLPEYMCPSIFTLLDSFPLTSNGKVDRKVLSALPVGKRELDNVFVAPGTVEERLLAAVWTDVLGVKRIGIHDDFFALGGHSLLAIRLMARLRKQFGRSLPLSLLFQGRTIAALAQTLKQHLSDMPHSPLVELRQGTSSPPLFLLHPAGGNIHCYAGLAEAIEENRPIYALQAPALEGERDPFTSVEEMAHFYLQFIRQQQPEGPYDLVGWSFGGTVAFEVAIQLSRQGQPVGLLALLDSWAPVKSNKVQTDRLSFFKLFLQDLGEGSLPQTSLWEEQLKQGGEYNLLAYLFMLVREQNMLPEDIDIQQFTCLFNVFASNMQAWLNYDPPVSSQRITLLRSGDDYGEESESPTLGWDELSTQVEVHIIPGNHYSILKDPHRWVLARHLGRHPASGQE